MFSEEFDLLLALKSEDRLNIEVRSTNVNLMMHPLGIMNVGTALNCGPIQRRCLEDLLMEDGSEDHQRHGNVSSIKFRTTNVNFMVFIWVFILWGL